MSTMTRRKLRAVRWLALAPALLALAPVATQAADLRLGADSPAAKAGQKLPAEWPDPLRGADKDAPDAGALPLGAEPWGVGVNGRIPLFGGR